MEIRTDNPEVAILFLAWQMTTTAMAGRVDSNHISSVEDKAKTLRNLFTENYNTIKSIAKQTEA